MVASKNVGVHELVEAVPAIDGPAFVRAYLTLVCGETRVTYGQLLERTDALAQFLVTKRWSNLVLIAWQDRVEHRGIDIPLLCPMHQRSDILGQTGSAESKSRA